MERVKVREGRRECKERHTKLYAYLKRQRKRVTEKSERGRQR